MLMKSVVHRRIISLKFCLRESVVGSITTVTETHPDVWGDGKDTAGSKGGDASTVNDVISNITLVAGDDAINYNFGELLSPDMVLAASAVCEAGVPYVDYSVTAPSPFARI